MNGRTFSNYGNVFNLFIVAKLRKYVEKMFKINETETPLNNLDRVIPLRLVLTPKSQQNFVRKKK